MAKQDSARSCVAVVDDDDELRRSFARLLRASGMQPVTYASAEALLADTMRPPFDCLVLDIQLPGMSGLDLQEQLNALAPGTPVVFITAYDDPRWRRRALAAGCAAFFDKGDAGREVLDAIRAVVKGSPRRT